MLFESEQNQKRLIQEVVYDVAPKHNLKKQVEFCLKSQWVSIAHPEWLQLYMSKDVELYNKVVEKFNDQAKTWSNTSWLFDH